MNFWWRIGLIMAALTMYTAGVWHVHTWYDGYKHQHETEVIADKAQKGQNAIVKFQQDLRKTDAKDKCLTMPIPADTLRLLK